MRIEFHLDGPATMAWFASIVPGYSAAQIADFEERERRWRAEREANLADGYGAATPATTPVEAEKPKATRGKKAETKPVEEPAAQITTSPEDRKPVDVIEDAVIVEEVAPAKVCTRADMQDAMRAYQARMGMEATMANLPGLLGAPKQSLVAEDPAVFEAVIARINAALEADPNG